MGITILPPRYWNQLEDIFRDEFSGSDLPEVDKGAQIFISTEGKKRTGFILVEPIRLIGQIYVYPEFRQENIAKTALSLVKFVQNEYDGTPVGCVASEPRFEKLYKLMKMDKIEGSFFRKN